MGTWRCIGFDAVATDPKDFTTGGSDFGDWFVDGSGCLTVEWDRYFRGSGEAFNYRNRLRFTTFARTKGLALDTIARQMGHESIATTQLYAQLADEVYEQEYLSFFDGNPVNRRVKKRRPDFHPDRDWAYR